MKRLRIAVLALLVSMTLLSPVSAHHGTETEGVFSVRCASFHTNNDDPIVFPGQLGAAHKHQYTGSSTTNANSTYASMRASTSRCPFPPDTAGYWWPALQTATGTPVFPSFSFFYYRSWADQPFVNRAFPAGLKVIAGPRTSDTINTLIGWNCANGQAYQPGIIDCPAATARLTANIAFPSCWDGVNLDTGNGAKNPKTGLVYANDHKAHMKFPTGGVIKVCPTNHPVRLPRLIYHIHWQIHDAGTARYKLSSDTGTQRGQSLHADFWNTWDQARMDSLTATCLIAHNDVSQSTLDPGCRNLVGS